jgi:NADP-dependent 3-hydroxy acid dehydrogenase YdfG
MTDRPIALITGASSGIGAATARRLATAGFDVVLAARRTDRIEALAAELDGTAVTCDVTSDADVARLAERVPHCRVLVNNAGGSFDFDPVEAADPRAWQLAYDLNVVGAVRVTKALLPALVASGEGTIVMMSSTAGLIAYENGGSYTAAKHGMTALAETLRLELCGRPVRVVEIDPGMVRTDEFSVNRFDGDVDRADSVYAGVAEPLVAEDVAECVGWAVTLPHHVNIDRLVVRPLAQAAQHKVHRVL